MDALLRPYGVGSTQWYILYRLANSGPTMQRDLLALLQIEKPTLSGVVATLVDKGWVEQIADVNDQRQRVLRLTAAGRKLWKKLPDPAALILSVAFDGVAESDLEIARRVLRDATERLNQQVTERSKL
jgi:MarR family transcriptional regulator, lower aerobic nicotinate degradation pathway regulator